MCIRDIEGKNLITKVSFNPDFCRRFRDAHE